MRHSTSIANIRTPVGAGAGALALVLVGVATGALGCASDSESPKDGGALVSTSDAGPSIAADAAAQDAAAAYVPFDSGVVIEIPRDSTVCSADLPFKPAGCACIIGDTAACWTGPASDRGRGDCKDGIQTCEKSEFPTWGTCENEVFDCGEPPAPPDPPCACVPGQIIGCDEDCSAAVFCAPSSTKVCQPDGTFGPCREALLPTADTNLLGCINVFHGCLAENPEGSYTGDCSKAFTCGHPPNASK